jgi:glycine dehydrogenase subunit 1
MVSELYGLPLANASLYDGASATAEGVLMARRLTKRDAVLASECVHPHYRETTQAYLQGGGPDSFQSVPVDASGAADLDALIGKIGDSTACVVVGSPSFLGPVTDLRRLADACHAAGALLVVAVVEPYALALVEAPGKWGADIVVGEGQPIACPPQYGGPGVGLLACRDDRKYLQQLPGRVCGETLDQDGKQGFVLTLSTREQHIRRERATSNICTNQGLLALAFTIRLALLGKSGFVAAAKQCLAKAYYLRGELAKIDGVSLCHPDAKIFNEFAIRVEAASARDLLSRLEAKNIIGGLDLGQLDETRKDQVLLAVTEQHTREDLDEFLAAVRSVLSH